VTVITSISYDHTYLLGETLAEIAGEKAGIVKPEIPLVVAPQVTEARQAILRIAEQRSAPVFEVGKDYLFRPSDKSLSGQGITVWSAISSEHDSSPVELSIPLLGDHQLVNAATAFATLMVAKEKGIEVSINGIKAGFQSVHWPGRFELLRHDPALIIDSAHNRDSARKLNKVLEDYFPGQKVVLVFGASEDKDISGMLEELKPALQKIVMTKSTHPRAADPEDLVAIARQINCQAVASTSVEAAMMEAERLADGQRIILVTGSIFVAAAARSVWMAAESEEELASIGK
jgi:dihydrofolate synthase/folylpolyglutamate synthase